ncbi:putative G-protein coupled receptor No9 [Halotydeus destructor]|nr:putative G-protein coupled receptor No9 [Halotydeus destructor]
MNSTEPLDEDMSLGDKFEKLPVLYTILEALVALIATIGNLLVIIVFFQDKRLRKVTNFYIFSLALADLLVGMVGVPSAILTRMGLPRDAFHLCLTMLSLLMVCCTISILNLVAVSLDRFWAILFPLNYHSNMSKRIATCIIVTCWIIGALIGFLPLFGVNNGQDAHGQCLFIPIMSYDFLVFLYFATIVFPAVILAGFYGRIYMVVIGQIRTVSTLSFKKENSPNGTASGDKVLQRSRTFPFPLLKATDGRLERKEKNGLTEMSAEVDQITFDFSSSFSDERSTEDSRSSSIRKSPLSTGLRSNPVKPIRLSYSRREVKKAQKLSIIVMFFMVCWVPLYTLNAFEAFWLVNAPSWLLDTFIILSHVNSALNPVLYAYHMKDFREAFRRLLCECVVRKQELRDRRRLELLSMTSKVNHGTTRLLVGHHRKQPLVRFDQKQDGAFSPLSPRSGPNSLLTTPQMSPMSFK